MILAQQVDRADRRFSAATSGRADNAGTCGEGGHPRSTRRHDSEVRPWKRRLSDDECSVLLAELLLRHPELAAEAEEITSTLLVVENEQELGDEITAKLRALRANGPVSVDTGRGRVLDVLQPYIDDLTRRKERGARRAACRARFASRGGACIWKTRVVPEKPAISIDKLARMLPGGERGRGAGAADAESTRRADVRWRQARRAAATARPPEHAEPTVHRVKVSLLDLADPLAGHPAWAGAMRASSRSASRRYRSAPVLQPRASASAARARASTRWAARTARRLGSARKPGQCSQMLAYGLAPCASACRQ